MKNKETKIRLSDKKLRMHIKLILATIKNAMDGCDTYDEFKFYINHVFEEKKRK